MRSGSHPAGADHGAGAVDAAPVRAASPNDVGAGDSPAWIPSASGLFVSALSLAVLLGWQLGLSELTHASPFGIALFPLSALGLLFGGAALWLLERADASDTRRGVGNVLAALVCALGVAVLVEYATSLDLGFDLLLYPAALGADAAPFPGRPSLLGAVHFALAGAALLLLSGSRGAMRAAQWLALASLLVATTAALGFLYRIPELYRPLHGAAMSLSYALLAVVLSLGVLFARRRVGLMGALGGADVGGLAVRHLLPIGVLLPVLLGALIAQAVGAGALDPRHGFFAVGAVLGLAYAGLVWRCAAVLRRIDRERRHAARGLVQSEERFRSLAENASDAIVTIDARGRIVFANPSAERLFGYSTDELTSMHLVQLMPERHRDAHREAIGRYERTGRRRIDWGGAEFTGLRRDGREVPLEITLGDYVRDGRRYFTGIIRDITERKQGDRSQRLLVEAGRVLSASLDPEATLRGVTRLTVAELADWCVVYGAGNTPHVIDLAARDLVKEIRLRELERRYPADPGGPVGEALRTGEPVLLGDVTEAERDALAYGGSEHFELLCEIGCESLLVVPLVTRGRTIGALALGQAGSSAHFGERDVATARELAVRIAFAVDNARLYEAARAARAQAESRAHEIERMTEIRARLMRGFSHDLKNPLGAAQGHAELLESGVLGALEAKQRDSIGRIRATIGDALGLIDELVELARAETGNIELHLEEVQAGRIVREVVDEHRPRAETKGLELSADDRPAPPALADAARVRQIVANLVTNAIKYTTAGRVTVRVGAERRSLGGDGADEPWIRIDVEDTGPGLTPEQQARMFEEFSRFAPDTPGAGLGLAISRNLAETMGGAITVRSAPSDGSCFTLWLKGVYANAAGRRPSSDSEPRRSRVAGRP